MPHLDLLQVAKQQPVLKNDVNDLLLVFQMVTPTSSLGTDGWGGTRACGLIAGSGCVSRETAVDICWRRINSDSAFQRELEETFLGFTGWGTREWDFNWVAVAPEVKEKSVRNHEALVIISSYLLDTLQVGLCRKGQTEANQVAETFRPRYKNSRKKISGSGDDV